MTLERQGGDALRVASMYVPALPRVRLQFLAKLEKKDYLKGMDIIGIDANCVANSESTSNGKIEQKPPTLSCMRRNLKTC